jgi:hypothetical protein
MIGDYATFGLRKPPPPGVAGHGDKILRTHAGFLTKIIRGLHGFQD